MKLTSILLFSIIALSISCRQNNYSATDHPEFQNKDIPKAMLLADSSKMNRGLAYLDSSYARLNSPSWGDQLALYTSKTHILFFRGSGEAAIDSALGYADSALNFIDKNNLISKYRQEYISLLFHQGDILLNKDKYEDAYASFYKAKQLLDQGRTACEQANFYAHLGLIYYRQGKYYNASQLFKQSFKNGKTCPENFLDFSHNQGALDNAGLSFLKLKMLDSAMHYFKLAQHYVHQRASLYRDKKVFMTEANGVILQNIGDTYFELFDFNQAEQFYLSSIKTSEKDYRLNPIAMQSAIRLAKLYIQTGRLEMGRGYLQTAKMMLKNNLLDPVSIDKATVFWNKTKLDYFIAKGWKDSIQIQSKVFLAQQQKMTDKEKVFFDTDPGKKFYDLQKDYELDILKKQNELNKLYFLISIILLVAATVILYLMYRQSVRSKSHNKKLTDLNQQITEQNLNLQNALDILEQNQIRHQEVQNVVMHDLRSPITGIALLAEHLLTSDNLTDDEKHMIELMKTSSEDSLKFVNDLLNDGSAPMELEKELVELDKLLNYCVNLLKYKASEKNQKITFSSEPVQFMLNREKIYRVLSNIITNAIKFSPPETEIKVNLKVIEGRSVITIEDHGIGIPEDMKKNIFNLQENVKREGTRGEKSYGIGLITSRKIVEAHAGKLWFESTVNKGSTFFIELPLYQQVVVSK